MKADLSELIVAPMDNPNGIGVGLANADFTGFKEHRTMTKEVLRAVVGFVGAGKYIEVKHGGKPRYRITVVDLDAKLIITPHEKNN